MIDDLIKLCDIYKKIDSSDIHKKFTNMKSMKLATILNRMFYYIEYTSVLIEQKDITNFNYYRYNFIISMARNVMELFNVYEYFGEYGITKEEYELRELCGEYHEALNMEMMHKKLYEYKPSKFNQRNIFNPISNIERHLKNNLVFQNSNEKWQKSFMSARKCYYFSRVKKKINILPHAVESVLYNLFSNYVHSFELGLGYDFFRGNNEMYSGLYQAILSVQVMLTYGAIILKDYISRRNLKKILNERDIKFINFWITYENIEKILFEWKNKYDFEKMLGQYVA